MEVLCRSECSFLGLILCTLPSVNIIYTESLSDAGRKTYQSVDITISYKEAV